MTTLLRVDSSSRTAGSISRSLGGHVEALWYATYRNAEVTRRDVTDGSVPLLSQDTVTGFFTDPTSLTDDLRAATALSDQLIAELQVADTLLITVPIYNFGLPGALKAWIDQVVRVGHTFSYQDGAFAGLAKTKRAILICVYGAEGYGPGEPFEQANFLEPYLRFLLAFIGIETVHVVTVQGTTSAPEALETNIEAARAELASIV